MYKSEEEFLKNYNSNKFEKLSLTSDILIFSVTDSVNNNYRKLTEKKFSILLVKRGDYPFKDKWCLPGGFVNIDETTEQAAIRVLKNETNLHDIYLEQLYTFDDINRDPRMRVVSTAYMSLVDKNNLSDKLDENASWFNMTINEEIDQINIFFDNDFEQFDIVIKKTLKEKTTDRYQYTVLKNTHLAFDHALVITNGISRLKSKIEYTDIVFNMMPKYFTLGELQQVYELILGKKLLDPAFRRIIANKVEKTTKMKTGGGHRPSVMFQYKNNQ